MFATQSVRTLEKTNKHTATSAACIHETNNANDERFSQTANAYAYFSRKWREGKSAQNRRNARHRNETNARTATNAAHQTSTKIQRTTYILPSTVSTSVQPNTYFVEFCCCTERFCTGQKSRWILQSQKKTTNDLTINWWSIYHQLILNYSSIWSPVEAIVSNFNITWRFASILDRGM